MPMFKAPKVKLFKVQFTKTIATYVLAREQKDLKRALEDVDLYDDLWVRGSPVRAIVEAVAKVTGIKQVTDVKGLPKDVTPWTSRDLKLPMSIDVDDPKIITDGDDLQTIVRKMQMVSPKPTKKGA